MECMHCKGKMARGFVPFNLDRRGYHIHWERIPAWVCRQCGEPFFETKEVEIIQQAASVLDKHRDAFLAEAV